MTMGIVFVAFLTPWIVCGPVARNVRFQSKELYGERREAFQPSFGVPAFDDDVTALD